MSQTATVTPAQESAKLPGGHDRAFKASLDYFLGPLLPLFNDPAVSEIMVNGIDQIYIETAGQIQKTPVRFPTEHHLIAAANNIAQFMGQTIGPDRPMLDGRLPDGSRVCIVLQPISAGGTTINVRRFSRSAVVPEFLIKRNAVTAEAMELLLLAVRSRQNLIVSGGTGSGKTTLLNVLSTGFDDNERVLVIEDTQELQVQKQHVVNMVTRGPDPQGRGAITIRDLFVTSLRMRPDRIIVGEVRRGEAIDMVQAMTSGHRGSLATLHASTPADACRRLETMALMADIAIPLFALRSQIVSALDLIVQTLRIHSGRRLITHISEVEFDETTNAYVVNDLFNLPSDQPDGQLRWTGRTPKFAPQLAWEGLTGEVKLTRHIFYPPATQPI